MKKKTVPEKMDALEKKAAADGAGRCMRGTEQTEKGQKEQKEQVYHTERQDLTVFRSGLQALGIALSSRQEEQFLQYYELLTQWNSFMNLTAITEFQEVMVKHFLDSLAIVKAWNPEDGAKVIDVGTGAGFPGIPLKIAFPELEITLLDSLNKRVKFLDTVIETLGLQGIRAVHGRAEELVKQPGEREGYDLAVSRAVANLSTLSEYCLPYVKVGGLFLPYKSGKVEQELAEAEKALKVLGGQWERPVYFTLEGTDMERSLIPVRKGKHTPKQYPRKAGTPGKSPIQ